ncbi:MULTISPECIES: transporter [unclassified Phyllobacterium]|uniref:transporter n=1 Tax=Phyllobacterium TaxID=28100 RepID=UPI000DD8E65F|nr:MULTISPECIES: transporter [unclassified Phyllobacterium]MBA8903249.1 hypothetical protein [Phyllobacterium sp. P30BS-XVII]UGX88397.1 transporter [Phyllobacterium sp. T1293]
MVNIRGLGLVLAMAASFAAPSASYAIDIMPGDYVPLPKGTNLGLLYLQYQTNKNLNIDLNGVGDVPKSSYDLPLSLLRYLHYSEIGGVPVAFQGYLPIGSFTENRIGGVDQRTKDGIGDLTLGATVFPLTGADKPGGTTVGITAYVTLPTGSYDSKVPFNIGNGTTTFTPQLGIIQNLGHGFSIDAAADVAIYLNHDEDGAKFSQDPSVQLQAYLRYNFSAATAVSFGYSGKFGGKQYVEDIYNGQKTDSHGLRAFASTFITPTVQVQAMVGTDLSSADGGFKQDFIGTLRLLKVF